MGVARVWFFLEVRLLASESVLKSLYTHCSWPRQPFTRWRIIWCFPKTSSCINDLISPSSSLPRSFSSLPLTFLICSTYSWSRSYSGQLWVYPSKPESRFLWFLTLECIILFYSEPTLTQAHSYALTGLVIGLFDVWEYDLKENLVLSNHYSCHRTIFFLKGNIVYHWLTKVGLFFLSTRCWGSSLKVEALTGWVIWWCFLLYCTCICWRVHRNCRRLIQWDLTNLLT